MWIGIHSCRVHSSDGSNFFVVVVVVGGECHRRQRQREPETECEQPFHDFTSVPKKATSEIASSSV